YISQHKQPVSLQVSHRNERDQFVIGVEYFHRGPLPQLPDTHYREAGTTEYMHRLEQLLGSLCRSGFIIDDFSEPCRADRSADVTHFGYRGRFVPPYLRIKARRRIRGESERDGHLSSSGLWIPGMNQSPPEATEL
ncbi:MAG: class I SAM-dependent methyltransferase, partial [Planctomycetaceae bacterium]